MVQRDAATAATARNRGFTLLEALVAFAIMTVGILGLLAAMVGSGRSNAATLERDLALEAASSQLERVLAHPRFETLRQTFDGQRFDVPPLTPVVAGERVGRITVTPWVDPDGVPHPDLLLCTVEVRWRGGLGTDVVSIPMWITDRQP